MGNPDNIEGKFSTAEIIGDTSFGLDQRIKAAREVAGFDGRRAEVIIKQSDSELAAQELGFEHGMFTEASIFSVWVSPSTKHGDLILEKQLGRPDKLIILPESQLHEHEYLTKAVVRIGRHSQESLD